MRLVLYTGTMAKKTPAALKPVTKKPLPATTLKKRSVPIRKILFIIFASIAGFFALIITSAFIFSFIQKPVYVNKDVKLANELRIPELLQPREVNGEKVFDLTLQKGETAFLPGKKTQTFGFNGSYLGPTIRASKGDNIRMNVTNTLGEDSTVHWHGMHLPAEMDGGPHQVIKKSENWQ